MAKPTTPEDYRLAVVHVRHDLPYVDGRLIEAVWRDPAVTPSGWRPGGRAHEWLAYWEAAAKRPDVVGSCYNPDPDDAARCWVLGVPAP